MSYENQPVQPVQTVPDVLTHYYRKTSLPFRTLTELSLDEVSRVISKLCEREPLPRRLETSHYLPRRRQIEQMMRDQWIAKGGRPRLSHPHYMILGTWSQWENDDGYGSVTIPLDAFDSSIISFTYPDSWVSLVGTLLSGEALPRFPYHGQVYRVDQLPSLIDNYGLPGERWRTQEDRRMETYIEAQIWDDAPLQDFMRKEDHIN